MDCSCPTNKLDKYNTFQDKSNCGDPNYFATTSLWHHSFGKPDKVEDFAIVSLLCPNTTFSTILQIITIPLTLTYTANMAQQNQHEVRTMLQGLESAKGGAKKAGKKGYSCKKTTYKVNGSEISVDSWKMGEWDYKRDDLPTYARGLFTTKNSTGNSEIVVRGYDKFFNINEVRSTEWKNIERDTVGPYELSVKENGCIIFISGLEDGSLLVCSKHSTGVRQDVEKSHAVVGEQWIERHVTSVGKTTQELAKTLRSMNATAVGELCDDEFEEHVLAYPPELSGLYIHGINFNQPEFQTLSGSEVHQFADAWGFKKAEYQIIQDLEDVKTFLSKCAETGSWNGRDTEGFVIRCKVKDTSGRARRDWFFKYKFEEPYLMYRQWREATKSIINGRPQRFKKHQNITEEYLLYARRQLAQNPNLAKLYNQNHGIIEMRDGFLAYKGKKGAEIIAEEEAENADDGHINVLLVPIATIGCGKTTVANALVKLFDWGHIQNDNIVGKGNRPARFTLQVTNAMGVKPVVIADRNNHQKREREQIINDVAKVIPDTKFVALHYVHDPKNKMLDGIRKVTQHRVLSRGDNHQTIQAASKNPAEIIGIMEGFLNRFEGCDTNREPDSNFDEVINLDVAASSVENLETVITHLYNAYPRVFKGEMPSHQDMEDAINSALNEQIAAENVHDLSFKNVQSQTKQKTNGSKQATPEPKQLSPDDLVKRLEYFGIGLSTTNINSILSSLFADSTSEESRFYRQLKGNKRVQDEYHVTLVHRSSSNAGGSEAELWQTYVEQYREALAKQDNKSERTPSLGPARLRLERVIWDDRTMGILVRILPSSNGTVWGCANDYPHITIGTAADGIKPVETNSLIQRWVASDGKETGIISKEIPGMKELDGAVKPVLQRGR